MIKNEIPDKPGVYTLIAELALESTIKVGRLGSKRFLKGFYTYTGSALGMKGGSSLRGRIRRHSSPEKKMRWHIDYLLAPSFARIVAIVYSETNSRMECLVSKKIDELEDAIILVEDFGSSDCHGGCKSHLHYFPNVTLTNLMRSISEIYAESTDQVKSARIPG